MYDQRLERVCFVSYVLVQVLMSKPLGPWRGIIFIPIGIQLMENVRHSIGCMNEYPPPKLSTLPHAFKKHKIKVPDRKGDIFAMGLRVKRETNLDLLLCHTNQRCQLQTLFLVWVLALSKMFLQHGLLFFGVLSAFLSPLPWGHGASLFTAIFI